MVVMSCIERIKTLSLPIVVAMYVHIKYCIVGIYCEKKCFQIAQFLLSEEIIISIFHHRTYIEVIIQGFKKYASFNFC